MVDGTKILTLAAKVLLIRVSCSCCATRLSSRVSHPPGAIVSDRAIRSIIALTRRQDKRIIGIFGTVS